MRHALRLLIATLLMCSAYADEVDIGSFSIDTSQVSASSVLYEKDKPANLYVAKNANDGNAATAWCSDPANGGIGEWLEFRAARETPFRMRGIALSNGYTSSEKQYFANNRIREIKVTVTKVNGRQRTFTKTLPDAYAGSDMASVTRQRVIFGACKIGDAEERKEADCFWHDIAKMRITVVSVYPGKKHNDTCISEVRWLQ